MLLMHVYASRNVWGSRLVYSLEHPPGVKMSWSMANPPLLALPSMSSLKSAVESISTWPNIHSGLAVFSSEADMDQIWGERSLGLLSV